ncbi:hypothetical protein GGR50DRAFT_637377 [Xylaria sp. CBS 124048]|nr:hypothetical protein GGR50DRAFT_637377 [Xylaria sp. CBS 124048]
MANLPSLDSQARVVSEAAQSFVENYYNARNKRQPLAPYYASTSAHLTSASLKPDISINGRVLESLTEYEEMLDKQGGPVQYDVAAFDAHVVNPNYCIGCPKALALPTDEAAPGRAKVAKSIKDGDRVSFVIQVNGSIRYGNPGEATADPGVKHSPFTPINTATTIPFAIPTTNKSTATPAGATKPATTATTPFATTTTPTATTAATATATATAATAAGSTPFAIPTTPATITATDAAAPTVTATATTVPAIAAAGEKEGKSGVEVQSLDDTFNETWLLVPHWEALGRNAARGLRQWVVISQNFRSC